MKKMSNAILIALLCLISTAAMAAQKTLTTYTWDYNLGIDVTQPNPIDGAQIVENTSGVITVEPDPDNPNNSIISLGNNIGNSCGVIWLGGAGTVNTTCTDNICAFGGGFRAYFEIRFPEDTDNRSEDRGDGVTFAMVNGSNNDRTRRGGPPPNRSMGELMCYAGSGNTANGLGLRYPKIALELDTYPNTGTNYNGCSGGRDDASNTFNHAAVMFWGDNQGGNCSSSSTVGGSYPRISYDDNIHDVPSSSMSSAPSNSFSNDGTGGYYGRNRSTYNWLEDNQAHRVRVEVLRNPVSHTYNVKAWIDCETCSGTSWSCLPCSETEIETYFKDVTTEYYNSGSPRSGSYPPKINRTVQLSSALPSFDTLLFGFTQATGGATQTVQIRNFKIHFIPVTSCPGSIAPMSASYGAAGGTGTVSVTAAADCSWTPGSSQSWINVSSVTRTGNGTFSYTVNPNSGPDRTGSISIGDLNLPVSQTGCLLSLSSSIINVSRSAGNATFSVNTSEGCSWTAQVTAGSSWLTITSGASGSGSGTVAFQFEANSSWFAPSRSGTITVTGPLGSQTVTIIQAGFW